MLALLCLLTCLFENTTLSAVPAMWFFNHPFFPLWNHLILLSQFVYLGRFCFSWSQMWVYDSRPDQWDHSFPWTWWWVQGWSGGPTRGNEIDGVFAGYSGRETNISPLDSLPAAILPLHRGSSWDHLGKNRVKEGGWWHHLGPWDYLTSETSRFLKFSVTWTNMFFLLLIKASWVESGHHWNPDS